MARDLKKKAETAARWHAANREKNNARSRAYNEAHRKERAAYGDAYRRAHRNEAMAYNAAYNRAHKAESAAYYEAHKEEYAKYGAAYRKAHPEKKRAAWLARKFNLTIDQFNALLASQNGCCAICGTNEPRGSRKRWFVDHCHATGKVRGILCCTCNSGLGMFNDTPEHLQAAIQYLEHHR